MFPAIDARGDDLPLPVRCVQDVPSLVELPGAGALNQAANIPNAPRVRREFPGRCWQPAAEPCLACRDRRRGGRVDAMIMHVCRSLLDQSSSPNPGVDVIFPKHAFDCREHFGSRRGEPLAPPDTPPLSDCVMIGSRVPARPTFPNPGNAGFVRCRLARHDSLDRRGHTNRVGIESDADLGHGRQSVVNARATTD